MANDNQALWRTDLARGRQLVSTAQLHRWLASHGTDRTDGTQRLLLFEVVEGMHATLNGTHIAGARWLDVQTLERAPLWNKVSDAELMRQLQALGIRHDSTVVLAGRQLVANARVAHLLLFAGVRDVRLLDGGTQAWIAAGLPLTHTPEPSPVPAPDFGLHLPACPQYLLDIAQVRQLLTQPKATLVSVRTWGEFIGKTSGYDYIAARGEIAGARWGHAGADGDVNDMSAFHTLDGLMRPAAEILQLWGSQDIHPGTHVAFYCGTGWRASLAFFYAWLIGWDNISVYDGGWMEWSSDPRNPVVNRQHQAAASQHRHAGA